MNGEKNEKNPGDHSLILSQIIASACMAGELSLLASLSNNSLVEAHMKLNRGMKVK